MESVLVLLLIGAVAGVMAGLLGIGGGLITVPALAMLFEHQGVNADVVMRCALGTSLAAMIFTSISSVRAHHARGAVRWPIVRQIAPGLVIGAFVGPAIAHWLPGKALKVIFGVFLLLVAVQLARGAATQAHRTLPGPWPMRAWGVVIGVLSSLFGIGGGTISVPFMTWCSVPIVQAVGTAATLGVPIALTGTVGYLITGMYADGLPLWSVGYVVLPAFVSLALATTLFAPLGARLAHRLDHRLLRRVFALFLVVVGVRLLVV